MSQVQYTQRELTNKAYTLSDVITAIKAVMNGRKWCSNAISRFTSDDRFTIVELNDLVEEVRHDTSFYG